MLRVCDGTAPTARTAPPSLCAAAAAAARRSHPHTPPPNASAPASGRPCPPLPPAHAAAAAGPRRLMWLEDQHIEIFHLGEAALSAKPVSEETVLEGLHVLLDPSAYPLLVMCNLGRHRTGTMIGCLRKLQGWNLTSILEEYRRHAGSKFRQLNEQFIELFDTDLVPLPQRRPTWLVVQEPAPTATGAASSVASASVPAPASRGASLPSPPAPLAAVASGATPSAGVVGRSLSDPAA